MSAAPHLASLAAPIRRVDDGPTTLAFYYAICEAQGLPRPKVLEV